MFMLSDFNGLLNAEPLMNAFRRNERCNKSLLWKWTIQNTLSAMNRCSEASLSVITALFVLRSPIRRMQSPIYLQNYPELWETVFPAPCCVSQCALWLKPQTRINMHDDCCSRHLVLRTGLFAKTAGLVVLCDFMPAAGSSQTPRCTFTVTDFTHTWSLARIQIVLLAQYNEQ